MLTVRGSSRPVFVADRVANLASLEGVERRSHGVSFRLPVAPNVPKYRSYLNTVGPKYVGIIQILP